MAKSFFIAWRANEDNLNLLQKVFELLDAALRPAETALGVTQIRHDESVLPGTVRCARPAKVTRRRRTVVDAAEPAVVSW